MPLLALAHGLLGFLGQAAFFSSLDRLAPLGLAAAAFPVSIGTTILSFSLYSALVLRERFRCARHRVARRRVCGHRAARTRDLNQSVTV